MTGSETGRPRAVVCLSGGMDSCVCAALTARDYEVYAIHFSYGQRTEARELRSAQEIARLTGVRELLPLKIDLFRRIGGSALTDDAIAVPEASAKEEIKTPAGVFQTIRVEPTADEGIVKNRGNIWVWYTDDARHMPVQIRAHLFWGTITARLQSYEDK